MVKRLLLWVIFMVLGIAVAGCGQKGDLYLPDNRVQSRDLVKPISKSPGSQPRGTLGIGSRTDA